MSAPASKAKSEDRRQKVALYKLFRFADRLDVILMVVGSIGAIANGAAQPISTLAFAQLVNSLNPSNQTHLLLHQVSQVSLKLFILAIGAAVAGFLQVFCWRVTGERQSSRIRGLYLKTILRQEIAFFDIEMITGDAVESVSEYTRQAMGEKVGKLIECSSTFISGFTIAFARGARFSMVLVLCIPAIVFVGGSLAVLTAKMAQNGQAAQAEAGYVVEQTLGAIRTVVSFSGEGDAVEKYDRKLKMAYKAAVKQALAAGGSLGLILWILFSTYGFAIWYGSKLILQKGYNGGDVVNVIIAIIVGASSIAQLSPCLSAFSAGQVAAFKIFEILNRQPNIDPTDSNGVVSEDIEGEIEFKDVFFRYPARPDVQIFAGFSLHIRKGKTLALVGASGSGKSSVISLLERFYDPDSGRILIDGIDLRKYKLRWIREKMGLVSQEPVLFSTTIRENVLYGKPSATEDEIRAAIEVANAAKFIDNLPDGLETMVGENGTQLSGGQRQRIGIARAILRNPKILLLDEATSALDTASERMVQDGLEKVMSDRTTLVVAHRLSTVQNAHLIAVMHHGKVVEQGTHNDLIRNPVGTYHQLVCIQERPAQSEDESHNNSGKIERTSSVTSTSSRGSQNIFLSSDDSLAHETKAREVDGKLFTENKANVSLKQLARLNMPELPAFLLGSIAASIHGVAFPVTGLFLATVITMFFETPTKLQKDSRFWAFIFVSVGAVIFIALPMQTYLFGVSSGKLAQRIRSLTFNKVVHQEIGWFDHPANSSGAVSARLSSDASTVRNVTGDTLALAVQNIATTIAGLLIALATNWKLSLVILVIVPLTILEGYMRLNLFKEEEYKSEYEGASQVANDAIGGIRTVASFSAEDQVLDMYQRKCKAPMRQWIRHGTVGGVSLGVANFVLSSIYAFSFYVGAVLTKHGDAKFSDVFKVFFAIQFSAVGIAQSNSLFSDFSKFKESAGSIFEILDRKPLIDSSSNDGLRLDTLKGDIRLMRVSFAYPTRPDIRIFKDLSLFISSRKKNALVGESGSGKSTVISLLLRFYDPDWGHISLDRMEIKRLNLSWLRQQMGLVSQEPILFNDTIRGNISCGRKATEEEIIAAARAAYAHTFIASLPDGYDTAVGEKGIQLSGGQKQRVAIARAVLKDPKILLLDEATSALDTESEHLVMHALDQVMVNRTTVIVAHRLSTVKSADTIAVLKDGKVAEEGNHDALIGIHDGIYASLVAMNSR